MKGSFFFLSACWVFGVLPTGLHAQSVEWAKWIKDNYSGGLNALCRDSSDNVYVTGRLSTGGQVDGNYFGVQGTYDMFLAKFNPAGEFQWGQRGGGDNDWDMNEYDTGNDVVYDPLSNAIYVCGAYDGYPATFGGGISFSGKGAFLAKYSVTGDCLWVRRTDQGEAGNIHINATGNILVTGNSKFLSQDSITFFGNPNIQIAPGAFVATYSSSGELLDARNLGKNFSAWITSEGDNYILVGVTSGLEVEILGTAMPQLPAQFIGLIAEFNLDLDQLNWVRIFTSPSSSTSHVREHVRLENGDHIISGMFTGTLFLSTDTLYAPPGEYRTFLARLDSTAMTEQWVMELGTNSYRAPRFSPFGDGTIVLATPFVDSVRVGGETFYAGSDMDFLVARIDTDGNFIGAVNNGPVTMSSMDVVVLSDGSVVLGSTFNGTIDLGNGHVLTGGDDIFVAKLGLITSVPTLKRSAGGALFIYANPNNGTCTIELPEELLYESNLVLHIMDLQGRLVQQSALRMHEGTIRLDIHAQAKGTYVAEVGNGHVRYTGRIVFE